MSQKYLAAFALASLAKPNPTAADVEAILKAVGASVEKDTLAFTMESIDGRSVSTLVSEGAAKLSAAPAAAGGAAPAAAAGAAPAAAAKKEEKVEEEEGDDDMGFGLFD